MIKFKNSARHTVAKHTAHGTNKSEAKKMRKISSIGSERIYRQCYSNFLKWCQCNNIDSDCRSQKSILSQYLNERREWIQQKTLNQERQALQIIFCQELPYLLALKESIYEKRSYKLSEVKLIVIRQSEKNTITTWLAFFSGIRAHEAATILPIHERKPSTHRTWDSRRFQGLSSYRLYTVCGKGGLVREVAVPIWLANMLEARRRHPIEVVDREVIYISHYDIGIGQAWSQSFTLASQKALGLSKGGHGLRHSFAKWRLHHLIKQFENVIEHVLPQQVEEMALLVLSQELGHFRLDIVYAYLR